MSETFRKAIAWNWPADGEFRREDINFTWFNDTSSNYSCSFQLHNQYYIVGGSKTPRQVSIVTDRSLAPSDIKIPFDFEQGLCAAYGANGTKGPGFNDDLMVT